MPARSLAGRVPACKPEPLNGLAASGSKPPIGINAIVAMGLVLLTGVAGLTSFGQAAFVGLGAYTAAFLALKLGLSPWLNLVIGIALSTLVALVLGAITLRLSGRYLPLATIAGA